MPGVSGIDAASVVVIGGSAGGVSALMKIIGALPADFPAPVVIVLHRTPTAESLLVHTANTSACHGRRSKLAPSTT